MVVCYTVLDCAPKVWTCYNIPYIWLSGTRRLNPPSPWKKLFMPQKSLWKVDPCHIKKPSFLTINEIRETIVLVFLKGDFFILATHISICIVIFWNLHNPYYGRKTPVKWQKYSFVILGFWNHANGKICPHIRKG